MTETENGKKSFEERALLAATRFLERKGFEILATGYRCEAGTVDIVARDPEEDVVSFVDVNASRNSLPDEGKVDKASRSAREKTAAAFLTESCASIGEPDFTVRFDVISLAILSDDRALLRYHTNVLAAEGNDEGIDSCTHPEARKWAEALSRPDSRGTSLARMLEDEISRRAEAEGWHCEWEQCLDEVQALKAS